MEKQLREPENWQGFEKLCKKLWGEIWNCPEIMNHGILGQNQAGVDIYGIPEKEIESKSSKKIYGIQCKKKDIRKNNIITIDEIDKEIEKAKEFKPDLKKYYIATTAKKDKKIEEYVRTRNLASIESGSFQIYIYFWEDIVQLIDENRHTHDWFVKNQGYKTNYEIDFTFDNNEKEITYKPKFLKKITEFKIDPLLKHLPDNPDTIQFLKSQGINVDAIKKEYDRKRKDRDLWSNIKKISNFPILDINKGYFNESKCNIKFRIKNNGSVKLEDYKIYIDFDGKYKKLGVYKYDNLSHKLLYKIESNDKAKLDPHNTVLVPKEYLDFTELYILPYCDYTEIKIKWSFLSSDFEENGELSVIIEPELIEKIETKFVENDSEVRTESTIVEYLV